MNNCVEAKAELAAKPELTEERRFQYLISGISDYAIYMLDTDGHVSSWNAGAQRFKGYKASLNDFAFVNKPYRLSDLARALRTAA